MSLRLRPHRSRRLLPIAALAVAGVLLAAGCGDARSPAAEVGSSQVEQASFNDDLRVLRESDEFTEFLQQQGFEPTSTESSLDSAISAIWLTNRIQQLAIDQEFDERGLSTDDVDEQQVRELVEQSFGGAAIFDSFSESFQQSQLEAGARRLALLDDLATETGPVSDDEVRQFYEANAEQFGGCPSGAQVSHILVETEDEAAALVAELDDGGDFAALAQERSTDTGSGAQGGALGCLEPGRFVAEFQTAAEAAPPGEPVGPVQTEFGWHVILVEPSEAQPLSEVEDQIRASLEANTGRTDALLQTTIEARLADEGVEVDPRFGSWVESEQGSQVQPRPGAQVPSGRTGETAPTGETVPEG